MMSPRDGQAADADTARRVLLDLPGSLWPTLLRSLRRTLGRRARSDVPAALRPFAGWKPERLLAERPRSAIAEALASDGELRASLAEELGVADDDETMTRKVRRLGAEAAAAQLTATARWDDLAALAADVAEREAVRAEVAAEQAAAREITAVRADRDRLAAELAEARSERTRLREELSAAAARAEAAETDRDALRTERDRLGQALSAARRERDEERRRARDREQRLRRRAEQAEARAAVDPDTVGAVAADLAAVTARLRAAVNENAASNDDAAASASASTASAPARPARSADDAGGATLGSAPADAGAGAGAVPREPGAAEPGRPCRLPPGLSAESANGALALLKTSGVTVLVDGYNVTRHPAGRPAASLADQRDWLVRLAGGLVARHRCRLVVVFDGTDPHAGAPPASRAVTVVFSEGDELADERLLALLDGLAADAPAVVVTSDREVADAARARHADVISAGTFLAAADR